jgi:signal transduction histidine kinase/CheY-like chemotaxis protein/HPt (histidine-containing phosphotransfer) domain-containing protein
MTFRDISISWKLTLLAVVTTLLSLVGVISAVALIDRQLSQMAMVESYVTMADVVGQNCLPSLEYLDFDGARRMLSSLRKDSQIALASLYNLDGESYASIQRKGDDVPQLSRAQQMNGTFTPDGFLHITRPIRRGQAAWGHLYLRISDEKLAARWWDQFVVAASVFGLSLLMAVALATRLQRFISGPVLHLVDTAHQVTKSGDYSIRAEKETGDELGELTDEFNEMLATIEARDAELDRHQQNLEELVSERTIELEQKTREATAASVAKSLFLANMSHEIRTPMNAIIGFANMLRQGNFDDEDERVEFLNTICASGEHLLGLISNILDLSKIEAGCMTTEEISVSPHQLMADVISITRVHALTKGLGLDYTWIGPVPQRIMTDPAKFRQLLINLIGNAIKFTERGGVHVIARLLLNHRRLQIQVIDSGIGIVVDKQDAIFTPFSQADASMTRRFGGTGLGLSISRKIAEALGGSLGVESEPGIGSTFTAIIDVGDIGQLEQRLTAPISDVIPMHEADFCEPVGSVPRGCRVLLVEDGDTNRRLIHKMLERHGIEVVDAVNGQVGVDLATTHEFDVILMDMQMPVKDGYTAATELRTKGLTIPIVALTAHAMSGDAEKCRRAGCSEYLTKPIQESRLMRKLAELLNAIPEKREPFFDKHDDTDSRRGIAAAKSIPDSRQTETAPRISVTCALPLEDETFREIVQEFSEKLLRQVDRMKLAYIGGDWDELVELAHWLKGSGGTAGYEQFTIPSGRLERMASHRSHERIETVLREIELLSHAVADELASLPAFSL